MVSAVAADYQDQITFLAIAGRSTVDASRSRVGVWFDPELILWAYDDSLWDRYAVPYQPRSFLISSDDVVVGGWFGALSEAELREQLDRLAAIG